MLELVCPHCDSWPFTSFHISFMVQPLFHSHRSFFYFMLHFYYSGETQEGETMKFLLPLWKGMYFLQ